MSRRRSLTCLAVVALFITLSPLAQAQDDPRKAQSTPLFEEGLRLADKGRQAEALEKFQKAHGYYPSPNTLFNIARTEQLLGRRLEAVGHYREALRNPVLLPQNAALAKQYVTELERVLGRITVTGPAGTRITIPGSKELRLPMNEPLDVEPGAVLVKGDHDGKALETKGLAVAGETVIVELKGKVSDAALPEPAKAPLPVEPPQSEPSAGWSTPRIVTTAALGAGAVTGLVLGFVFHGKANDAAAESRAVLAPVGGCNGTTSAECTRAQALESDHDRDVTLSTVSFVGAGVLGAAAIGAAVLWPSARTTTGSSSPRVTPIIHRTALGADLAFSF